MFFKKPMGTTEYLIVGLGNPGREYEGTRHNVGFLTVDELAARQNLSLKKVKHRALTDMARFGEHKVLLMKPQTYMNLSGQSVGEAARFHKIPPERILVITDDTDLPPGKLRLRRRGSAGGHNGLKSLIAHLGTDEFPRIKIGVGAKPHKDYDMAAWVLGRFEPADRALMKEAILQAADAATLLLAEGPDRAMARYNG